MQTGIGIAVSLEHKYDTSEGHTCVKNQTAVARNLRLVVLCLLVVVLVISQSADRSRSSRFAGKRSKKSH